MKIKNWDRFQHYKSGDRHPDWIKLYKDIVDDLQWFKLDPVAAKALISMWLIASEADGYLPDSETLAFRLRMSSAELNHIFSQLNHWVEPGDISTLAPCYQDACLEEEEEENKKENKKEKATKVAYSFQGKIIKLTTEDYANWKRAFSKLDLDAELYARDAWLCEQEEPLRKKWFQSTAALLRNRNQEASSQPPVKTNGYGAVPRGVLPSGRLEFRGAAAKPDPKPMTDEERKKADEVWRLAKQSLKTVSVQ